MATTATKVTLADFGPSSVWFVSVARPTGEMIDLTSIEDPDTGEMVATDPADAQDMIPFEWDRVEGTVDEDGDWAWDGKGNPTDWANSTVYRIRAYKA